MKPSLQLKLGQQLAMTPQLQQAIRLLQLSTLDLQQEIQDALDTNPLLELDDAQEVTFDTCLDDEFFIDDILHTNQQNNLDTLADPEYLDATEALGNTDMPVELPLDTSWDAIYSANTEHTGLLQGDEPFSYQGETKETLHDYLNWQVQLTPFTELDNAIAITILDAIDDKGYLTISLEDIQESLGIEGVELDEIETVLKRIQQFEPLGVGSRSLQECLLLQLAHYPKNTPFLTETCALLKTHMDLLANRDFRQILKATKLKESELKMMMDLIQTLNPRPGNFIVTNEAQYIVPDVSVIKIENSWQVLINPESIPRLKINQDYAKLCKKSTLATDGQFIRNHEQDAKWLIKSLESRNDTLLKVAQCIAAQQQDFFEYGEEAMKPMVLNDIAQAVDMHESTISRITTQKFMHTPRGIFELKYFFSSHVNTENGGECSSTAIRALVRKMVAGENPVKPLSDSKITTLLAQQGIQVARRTIAKYRESLGIAPSNQRKRLM